MIDLYELEVNKVAKVCDIKVEDKKRLLEIGFVINKPIIKIHESFNKDMSLFKINGMMIGLRAGDCKSIFVEVGE